jgi:hypothetical protein
MRENKHRNVADSQTIYPKEVGRIPRFSRRPARQDWFWRIFQRKTIGVK